MIEIVRAHLFPSFESIEGYFTLMDRARDGI